MGIYLVAKVAGVTLNMDANARKNVKSLINLAAIIKTVTTKAGVRRKLNFVFAKNLTTNVFMVLYAIAIRIVAKKACVIQKDAFASGEGNNLND